MIILYHHRIGSRDGQFVHLEALVSALGERGHEIVVVGPRVGDSPDLGSESRWVAALRSRLPKGLYEALELVYSLHSYRRLARAIRRYRPDVIYERYNLFSPAGVWASRRFGIPLLLEVNAPLFSERSRYGGLALPRLAEWSERYTWRGASRLLPVTGVLGDLVAEAGVPTENITVIPNGIHRRQFDSVVNRETAKRSLGLEGRLVLGFVGFVREWHHLEWAVDVLTQDRSRHLLLVGDGPARDRIVSAARAQGVRCQVTVTGILQRSDIARYLSAFDIALQPDVVPYASPLKLFEYLAMGCAVVAPSTPNLREVLCDGDNALLFKEGDPGDFARKVEQLCGDQALRARLGKAARNTIDEEGYTWEGNALRIERLARELIVRGGNRAAVAE